MRHTMISMFLILFFIQIWNLSNEMSVTLDFYISRTWFDDTLSCRKRNGIWAMMFLCREFEWHHWVMMMMILFFILMNNNNRCLSLFRSKVLICIHLIMFDNTDVIVKVDGAMAHTMISFISFIVCAVWSHTSKINIKIISTIHIYRLKFIACWLTLSGKLKLMFYS